jgi:hypothetical protein
MQFGSCSKYCGYDYRKVRRYEGRRVGSGKARRSEGKKMGRSEAGRPEGYKAGKTECLEAKRLISIISFKLRNLPLVKLYSHPCLTFPPSHLPHFLASYLFTF